MKKINNGFSPPPPPPQHTLGIYIQHFITTHYGSVVGSRNFFKVISTRRLIYLVCLFVCLSGQSTQAWGGIILKKMTHSVNPTCRFSLLTDMSNTNQYWTLSLSDHFGGLIYVNIRHYTIWGHCIIYLRTRHKIGYRVGFTTAKLLNSGQYQKILKISALSGLTLQYVFLQLATFSEFNCISIRPHFEKSTTSIISSERHACFGVCLSFCVSVPRDNSRSNEWIFINFYVRSS